MPVEIKMSECGVLFETNLKGAPAGRLSGKTFVVKDLFDVEGFATGGGNPDWLKTHAPAAVHAAVVRRLLEAGADLIGKSCTDELAMSLDGINPYYGIPINTQLPERIPGGSSSGSASAVAAGYADFGVGTDTVGSIRVPASYCGLYGFRPTHGAIDLTGCMPLGQSFDTAGWVARDAEPLLDIGRELLPVRSRRPIESVYLAENLFKLIPPEISKPFLETFDRFANVVGDSTKGEITEHTLDSCASIFGVIRSAEAWRNYRDWIETEKPTVSQKVLDRLNDGRNVSAEDEAAARQTMQDVRDIFDSMIQEVGVIVLPTAYSFPPVKSASVEELDLNRTRNIRFTVLSVVTGLPQVSIPVEIFPGVRLGLSILGGRNRDLDLLEFVAGLSKP